MSSQPSGTQADSKPTSPAPSSLPGAASGGTHWLVVPVLGLLGGLLAGFCLEQTHTFFPVIEPKEVKNVQILTTEQRALVDKAHLVADNKNIPFSIGLMGAAVAGAVGLSLALLRPAPRGGRLCWGCCRVSWREAVSERWEDWRPYKCDRR